MIVTRTPFRVTLGGGGTDLPSYYREHGGFIFAMGLDKYMYIMVNPPTVDRKIRLQYSKSEIVDHVSELHHDLAREALRLHGIEEAIEVSSMADLPAGAGVGSSSTYLVGLLTAIRSYRRKPVPLQELAEEACHIELNILKKPIGKQDQYMATFGGLTVLNIDRNGTVKVETVDLQPGAIDDLVANTHIYYTGVLRSALDILSEQNSALAIKQEKSHTLVTDSMHRIKELGYRILEAIREENFDAFGQMLDEHWQSKKRMSGKISLKRVDELYDLVRKEYNVLGGKIIGAGGGGFIMLYCNKDHKRLNRFMEQHGMMRLHYAIEFEGSKVVTNLFNLKRLSLDHSRRTG